MNSKKSVSLKSISITLISIYVVTALLKNLFNVVLIGDIWALIAILYLGIIAIKHSVLRYGTRHTLAFFMITAIVSWSLESLSITTGFPFGHYHYTSLLGFKIGLVPGLILPAYFAMGYLAWTMSHIILSRFEANYTQWDFLLIPAVSSLIMVAWDLTFDPLSSTVTSLWVWEQGGAYFGVPFQNFVGWYFCVFIIFALFFQYIKNKRTSCNQLNLKSFWLYPTLTYLFFSFETVTKPLRVILGYDQNVLVPKDNANISLATLWYTFDIYVSLALVSIFTMIMIGLFTLVLIVRNNRLIN
jgi:putative membrane protein